MSSFDFTPILNWRLLAGSHAFPGPDGGTCINEAAIVAAGFEYRKIASATECPPCFSRPLSAYLIRLNDAMPDDKRQNLMRFVMRLSGSADTLAVEVERVRLIVLRTVQRILAPSLELRGLTDLVRRCRDGTTFEEAKAATSAAVAYAADATAAATIWDITIEIAEEAFSIGNQATPDDVSVVTERLESAKRERETA